MGGDKAGQPKIFVDSNVVLNLLSADDAKADRSEALLGKRPTISVQVLNEVASVCQHQLKMSWREVGQFLDDVTALCHVTSMTLEAHSLAQKFAERYGLAFRDACIVATATIEGCGSLYTQDMNGYIQDVSLALKDPFV
ncbi:MULTISPECIES: PIN domain-containing protein [Pseudomonas]|uniref:PIN domain-containing protein n=1 Tax=Pseudomonas TaxID=286 RepID=UPI00235E35DE|nr:MULTISPECIES: PIN domain-containing protein [Pseudomonas]WJV25589.1 PIN domain-containing protein [Pseudomonas chlororaphis]